MWCRTLPISVTPESCYDCLSPPAMTSPSLSPVAILIAVGSSEINSFL